MTSCGILLIIYNNMLDKLKKNKIMTKEIKITPPEGYELDEENSTFECIKFKPIAKRWRDSVQLLNGVYVIVQNGIKWDTNYYQFATKKQAKSALAMAQISQIMANDERFGGVVTDEEWNENNNHYYVIFRRGKYIASGCNLGTHRFLAFHTAEQRDLFLEENEDLAKDYLMID